MEKHLLHQTDFLSSLMDIIPGIILIVDEDLKILDANRSSVEYFKVKKDDIIEVRSGEALHCIYSEESPEGCGRGPNCPDCIIRNSVNSAVKGMQVSRRQTVLNYKTEYDIVSINILVTASPFLFKREKLILLIIEDISELVQLRKLLPICANCKKIRDDKNYWNEVDAYFSERMEVKFSHGICPDCMKKLYPGF